MSICKKINIPRSSICTGDLDKYIGIYIRTTGLEGAEDDYPQVVFALIKNVWAGIVTPSPMERFNGITVNDRISNLVTHIFYINYDSSLPDLETGNHFIKYNNDDYKVLSVMNNNEQNQFIMIYTTNRGDDTLGAAEA